VTTATSRSVSMISREHNPNPVIDARWQGRPRFTFATKMSRCITILFLGILFLCCEQNDHADINASHLILIGTEATPPYSHLKIGDQFGEDSSVMVGSPNPFGTIEVKWDGKKEATFDTDKDFFLSKSISLTRKSGHLEITGFATDDLVILHLYGNPLESMELKGKFKIPKTKNLQFNLNLG
jgi:hypothetical protein